MDVDLSAASSRSFRQDAVSVVAEAYRIDLDRWNGNFGQGQRAPDWIDKKYPMAAALLQTWSGRVSEEKGIAEIRCQ